MTLSPVQSQALKTLLTETTAKLHESGLARVRVTEFVPQTKRFFLRRKARFIDVAEAWQLGVLLITTEGELYAAGEATRAVPPGHPGHVSRERERRREYTRIAFESGYSAGEVLYFDSTPISVEPGAHFSEESLLTCAEGIIGVRWNPRLPPSSAVPITDYLEEQIALRMELESPT